MASGPASPPPSRVLPAIPKMVGAIITPPFLYQEMENLGADGGLMEKPPEIEICGNFRCGKLQEKFMIDFILSIALWTASRAALILSVIADLMASNTLSAVDFAAFSVEEIVDLMFSNAEETVEDLIYSKHPVVSDRKSTRLNSSHLN